MSWLVTLLRLNHSFSVVLGTLPFAITTTGHGSFDIDLTAPITTGKNIGELRLETGACLLIELPSLLTSLTRCQTLTPSREIIEQKLWRLQRQVSIPAWMHSAALLWSPIRSTGKYICSPLSWCVTLYNILTKTAPPHCQCLRQFHEWGREIDHQQKVGVFCLSLATSNLLCCGW